MKIRLLGKNLQDLRPLLGQYGLEESAETPELIIAHGGDGTMLGAEREFPGVPKLALRDAATAPTCARHELNRVLAAFAAGKLPLTRLPKLSAESGGERLTAINDLMLHNVERSSALRYQVSIDGEIYKREILGDGACLSSVHGSTAYYRSITHSIFRVGIGLAFSNSTEEVDHLVLSPASVVKFTILRGPGMVVADNDPRTLMLEVGDSVEFRQTRECALIYGLEGFMCPVCRRLRHSRK